ncbi:hypothetical protein [Microbacterium sp. K27]|uniref:hypothetical protein n=1 Tax=Microbacterium sp. K27 TaxID=2305445 RepID=UPI00109BE33E|nr:hypothetical protein [Microbacterium sp. K27]
MNRYAALAIAMEASEGKRILVITEKAEAIRAAVDEFAELPDVLMGGARIRLANGAERIDFPGGGSILFRPARGSVRGYAAHTVFLDAGVDHTLTVARRQDLAGTLHTTGGDIIRA